jgi:hypothetical protein
MPHPIFHTLNMKAVGVTFYSRECCQFRAMVDQARDGQENGLVPKSANLEGFVLNYQAEHLYRSASEGEA